MRLAFYISCLAHDVCSLVFVRSVNEWVTIICCLTTISFSPWEQVLFFQDIFLSPLIHVHVLCFKTLCWEILISYVVRLTTQNIHSLGLLQQASSILIHDCLIKIRTKYAGRTFPCSPQDIFFLFSSAHQVETILVARN